MVFPMVWALLFVGLHGFPAFPGLGTSGQALREMVRSFTEAEVEPQAMWVPRGPNKIGWKSMGHLRKKCPSISHLYTICITRKYIYIWKYTDSSMVSTVIINFWTSKNHKNKWTYLEHIWIWKDMMLQNPGHPAGWRLFAEAYKPTGDW